LGGIVYYQIHREYAKNGGKGKRMDCKKKKGRQILPQVALLCSKKKGGELMEQPPEKKRG